MDRRLPEIKTDNSHNDSKNKTTSISIAKEISHIQEVKESVYVKQVGIIPNNDKSKQDKKKFMIYISESKMRQISRIAKNKGYSLSEYIEKVIDQQISLEGENR
jgi:predicted HicB family RNase H-like nuclease